MKPSQAGTDALNRHHSRPHPEVDPSEMKSFFSRLRGTHTPPPLQSSSSPAHQEERENPATPNPPTKPYTQNPSSKSRSPVQAPNKAPLRSRTPLDAQFQSSSSSSDSTHPRSTHEQSEAKGFPDIELWEEEVEGAKRTASHSGEGGGKKVTFRSPAPTPTASVALLDIPPQLGSIIESHRERDDGKVEGDQNTSASLSSKPSAPAKLARPQIASLAPTSQSVASSRPLFSSRQSLPAIARKASLPPLRNMSRSSSSSHPNSGSQAKSRILSPTPSDASLGETSTGSYLPPPNSWSEMAEEELKANLGPRERTRQEVLWEIVSSEERSVPQCIAR